MAVVVDPISKTISLSVRDLIEEAGFRRIGFDRGGWMSLGIGAEVHDRVLTARVAANPAYRKEVHVQVGIPIGSWKAIVTGRIDGCLPHQDGSRIEEFKTAFRTDPEGRRFGSAFERHRRQLLLYCDLWTRLGNRVSSARLVYVDPAQGSEDATGIPFDPVQQASDTEGRLRRVLADWECNEEVRLRKAAFAGRMPFPHQAPRPCQQALIHAVRDSLESDAHLLAEAPTGSGKTAATLHPALQHTLRTGRQLLFLTSKTLQQEMALRVLEAMNPEGVFRTVQLRAKEKMCANDRVLCHEDACPYARNFPAKMERSGLLDRLLADVRHQSPSAIFHKARAAEVCPFEVQLLLARRADAIVADYNYVFDPGTALGHLRDGGLGQTVVLVDEAHNLPDRLRTIFSPELLEADLRTALAAARQLSGPDRPSGVKARRTPRRVVCPQLDFSPQWKEASGSAPDLVPVLEEGLALMAQLATKSLPPHGDGGVEIPPPYDAIRAIWQRWEPRFAAYASWKQSGRVTPDTDPLVDFHFALLRFLAVMRLETDSGGDVARKESKSKPVEGFTTVLTRRQGSLRLAVLCLDPALPGSMVFGKAGSTVCLSATLQPFAMFRKAVGMETDRTVTLTVPSPFPPENRRILIYPKVCTTFAAREENFPGIAALLAGIDLAHDGNKLVLFPSYSFLARVVELLALHADTNGCRVPGGAVPSRPRSARIRIQSANATDVERQDLLQSLEEPAEGGTMLLAVLGGMFAEGVDYPGALLETVVVVSPGLPQPAFGRELLRHYHDEREGNGFEHAYLQPGMTRVIQAAGRLIRSETDRGVILLVCRRFLEHPYVDRLPRDWYGDSPRELASNDPAAEMREFFGSKRGKARRGLEAALAQFAPNADIQSR